MYPHKVCVYRFFTLTTFPVAGDVWFSFGNKTFQNNSIVTLENIGNDALLCRTNLAACCRTSDIRESVSSRRNWYFPNGRRVPSDGNLNTTFYRTRGQMVVRLNRRRGGEDGIYRCEIPDSMDVTQTIYIGVYTVRTGE